MSLYPKLGDSLSLSSDEETEGVGDCSPNGLGRTWLHRNDSRMRGIPQYGNFSDTIPDANELAHGGSGDSATPNARQQSPKLHRGPGSKTSVPLSDFEEEYFGRRSAPSYSRRRGMRQSIAKNGGSQDVMKWFKNASRWQVVLFGCALGLLCAVLYGKLLGGTNEDNHLPCPPANKNGPCLTESQLKPALLLANTIKDFLHTRAGQYECGMAGVSSQNVSLEELRTLLPEEYTPSSRVMEHAFYLILYNPQWGVRWVDSEGGGTSWIHKPSSGDILESSLPAISTLCRISIAVGAFWTKMKLVLIVILAVLVVVCLVRWYQHQQKMEKQAVFITVDRIIDVLRHHEATRRKKDVLPYLAIIHVRDMLIPPSERKQKQWVWEKACKWIASHESRVRVESRRIAGEDFQVWRWIQADPPKTEEPQIPSTTVSQRRNFWQGRAFEDYPPSVETKVAPPAGNPSQCIRLKNMFEPTEHMDDDQALEIENSILDRCISHGGVLHVYVDRRSTYGCVYLKMDSVKSATGAYKALHGGWYKGKLVTAKYIPDVKYHKWFPHAANAKRPLYPT